MTSRRSPVWTDVPHVYRPRGRPLRTSKYVRRVRQLLTARGEVYESNATFICKSPSVDFTVRPSR